MTRLSRRLVLQSLLASAPVALLAACQPAAAPAPTAVNPLIKPATQGAPLTPLLASSELAVGRNRFAVGLIDSTNQLITKGTVFVEFFKVDSAAGKAEKRFEAPATFRAVDTPTKGIWVTRADFPESGAWGISVTLNKGTSQALESKLSFDVKPKFTAPGYGEAAVKTKSPTLADVANDASQLCSNSPPCDMHALSVDQALANGKPTVIAFVTPAFCTSATCGPQLNAVQALKKSYGEKANFVHVEIYKFPFSEMKPVSTVTDWKLPSEPWVFLVDRQGMVQDRFEGTAPSDEMEPSLKALV